MKIHHIIWILIILSIAGTVFIYPMLPEQIPMHWNAAGEVDRMGDKIEAFITAALPLFIAALLYYLPKLDPKRESYQKHKKAYTITSNVVLLFLIGLHWVSMSVALGYSLKINLFVGLGVGLLFIVLGNYMGQIRHNYTFGIRTPWTLANETVWKKTHRLGSWVFIISGILLMIAGIAANAIIFGVMVAVLIIGVMGLFVYSYMEYRKLEPR